MIIVVGSSPSLVPCVIDQLRSAWLRADGPLVDESCRDAVVRTAATAIVIACPPPVLGARCIEPWDESLVRDALAATEAPSHPRLVWVTGRSAFDPLVREVRRHGADYVVLRSGAIVPLDAIGLTHAEDRSVLMTSHLAVPKGGVVVLPLLARAVEDACTDDRMLGRVIEVGYSGPDAWSKLVSALGATPRTVSAARAALARWLGQPVIDQRSLERASSPGWLVAV